MKARTLSAATLVALFVGPAVAADLPPLKEPPPYAPLPAFTWEGAYAGFNAGAAIGASEFAYPASLNGAAFTGGLELGYNSQVTPNFVAGFEADVDYRGPIGGGGNNPAFVSSSDNGYLGTFRLRLGYVALDHLLIYGTGGVAYGNVIAPTQFWGFGLPGAFGVRINHNDTLLAGWTGGGGVEYAINPTWSVKAEYLYAQLEHFTPAYWTAVPSFAPVRIDTRSAAHIVRAGVNYHFNWLPPAPVVAKF
jgi:outer membrane immunogenic protein